MAICVTTNPDGTIVQSLASIDQCMGHVLLNQGEYQNVILQHSVLALPSKTDFAAAWGAGFVLPMTVGLVAYFVGQIVKVWDK